MDVWWVFMKKSRCCSSIFYAQASLWHKVVLLFFLKTENCIFLLTRFHSKTSSKGKKLNVSISGGERWWGGEATEKEGRERGGEEGREEWGDCRAERTKERPTESDRPAASPLTDALILPQKRSDCTSLNYTHLSVNSLFNTRNIWRRTGKAARSCTFPPFCFFSFFFVRDQEKVPRP